MRITWYGHSCFKIESGSGSVVFDPYSNGSVPGLELPKGLTADVVICSHGHTDHNAEGLVALSGSTSSEIQVETLYTWHDGEKGAKRGENRISVVQVDGIRVAHLGDIGCDLTTGQKHILGRLDVLMLPVGGKYTIDAPQAKRLADELNAAVTVPMHYKSGSFGLADIAGVEDYAALCGDVEYLDSDTLEIERRQPGHRTVVFKLK